MWKEFEISTKNNSLADLGIDEDQRARFDINLSEVIGYYESCDNNDVPMVNVIVRGGVEYGVYSTYDEFKTDMLQCK